MCMLVIVRLVLLIHMQLHRVVPVVMVFVVTILLEKLSV